MLWWHDVVWFAVLAGTIYLLHRGAVMVDADKLPPEVRDLWRSATAKARGISNLPTDPVHLRRLAWLATVEPRVLAVLRARWPQARRTSAYRAPSVNAAVDGSPSSLHAQGLALDFTDGGSTSDFRPWLDAVRDAVRAGVIPAPLEVIAESNPPHLHIGWRDPFDGAVSAPRYFSEIGDRARGERRKLVAV